jgi:hypothetical protein
MAQPAGCTLEPDILSARDVRKLLVYEAGLHYRDSWNDESWHRALVDIAVQFGVKVPRSMRHLVQRWTRSEVDAIEREGERLLETAGRVA